MMPVLQGLAVTCEQVRSGRNEAGLSPLYRLLRSMQFLFE